MGIKHLIVGFVVYLLVALPLSAATVIGKSDAKAADSTKELFLREIQVVDNVVALSWEVPGSCTSGDVEVWFSKTGDTVDNTVSLGHAEFPHHLLVTLTPRRDSDGRPWWITVVVKTSCGIYKGEYVLQDESLGPAPIPGHKEIYPRFLPALGEAILIILTVATTSYDVKEAYTTCTHEGFSRKCKAKVSWAVIDITPVGKIGDGIKIIRHAGEVVAVSKRTFEILKDLKLVEVSEDGWKSIERFKPVIDDIIKHGDDVAKVLHELKEMGIPVEIINNEIKHGATLKEILENVKCLLSLGLDEGRLGRVIEYEAEHGITIAALKDYANNLIEMGVSKEEAGYVIAEAAEHGASASALTQGLEMFLDSILEAPIDIPGMGYKVVLEKGNEKWGLIHAYIRHVRGYEMEDSGITTFWPMWQKIVEPKTGRVVQLPKVFRDERELRGFLDGVLEKALNDPKYAGKFKEGSVTLTVELSEVGVYKQGITSIEFAFEYKNGVYYLKTVYPKTGYNVWAYKAWKKTIEPVG